MTQVREMLGQSEGYAQCVKCFNNMGASKLSVAIYYSEEEKNKRWISQKNHAIAEGGQFDLISDLEDMLLYENNTHYMINDCGYISMFRKEIE